MIHIDPKDGVPIYRQVMDQIKLQVTTGQLAPGEQLESVAHLSRRLKVNPMTISKAYSFLEKEGVVERRPGRPVAVKRNGGEQAGRELLRNELAGTVTIVRQLGIKPAEAVELFRSMLSETDEEDTP